MQKFTSLLFLLTCIFLFPIYLFGQTGCPGCMVDVPAGLSADTIYLDLVPDGTVFTAYDEDVSFRLPITTTPVAANDPTVPSGLSLDEIKILFISNLPPGLEWETNEETYFPDTETDGCVKLCGTPLQAGTYLLDIVLEVKVGFLTQESTFQRTLIIQPSVQTNDGFTMTNGSGCGSVTVDFENNILSNGANGFSYSWDFGNGTTSNNETPAPQIYNLPGAYPVHYQAVVDTSDFTLTKIKVLGADCGDIFGGNPDLYLNIIDPNGNTMTTSDITNTNPPVEFNFNMPLIEGNYTLVVMDEDGGINGQDDECDFYSFNRFSNGILVNGGSSVELTILHPVDTIRSSDTVYVYQIPEPANILYTTPDTFCESDTLILNSSYPSGNQWFLNGTPISGATEASLQVEESGIYSVGFTNSFGCSSISNGEDITIDPLPSSPIYNNSDNLLEVSAPSLLPANYSLQWFYEGALVPGETGLTYCLVQSGEVTLEVTDTETGCINSFSNTHEFNSDFNCGVVSLVELVENSLEIFPNPFQENLNISFDLDETQDFEINVIDVLGKKITIDLREQFSGKFNQQYSFQGWIAGVYILEIGFGENRLHRKIVVQP